MPEKFKEFVTAWICFSILSVFFSGGHIIAGLGIAAVLAAAVAFT